MGVNYVSPIRVLRRRDNPPDVHLANVADSVNARNLYNCAANNRYGAYRASGLYTSDRDNNGQQDGDIPNLPCADHTSNIDNPGTGYGDITNLPQCLHARHGSRGAGGNRNGAYRTCGVNPSDCKNGVAGDRDRPDLARR